MNIQFIIHPKYELGVNNRVANGIISLLFAYNKIFLKNLNFFSKRY